MLFKAVDDLETSGELRLDASSRTPLFCLSAKA
jgi:hypothetical protein